MSCDEFLSGLHIVIRMLIGRQQFSSALAGMIAVVRFDEAVVGKVSAFAVIEELFVGAEDLRLVFQ